MGRRRESSIRQDNGSDSLTLVESVLSRLFERQDVYDQSGDGSVYLRRWFIYKHKNPEKMTRRLMLHKFYRGDVDIDHHDHPWDFTSLILKGGYWEESFRNVETGKAAMTWYKPLSLIRRAADWAHRVVLPEGQTCWTLVMTSPKKRSWGFYTVNGWCPWRRYVNGDKCGA